MLYTILWTIVWTIVYGTQDLSLSWWTTLSLIVKNSSAITINLFIDILCGKLAIITRIFFVTNAFCDRIWVGPITFTSTIPRTWLIRTFLGPAFDWRQLHFILTQNTLLVPTESEWTYPIWAIIWLFHAIPCITLTPFSVNLISIEILFSIYNTPLSVMVVELIALASFISGIMILTDAQTRANFLMVQVFIISAWIHAIW